MQIYEVRGHIADLTILGAGMFTIGGHLDRPTDCIVLAEWRSFLGGYKMVKRGLMIA